jgi:hypothetical protein
VRDAGAPRRCGCGSRGARRCLLENSGDTSVRGGERGRGAAGGTRGRRHGTHLRGADLCQQQRPERSAAPGSHGGDHPRPPPALRPGVGLTGLHPGALGRGRRATGWLRVRHWESAQTKRPGLERRTPRSDSTARAAVITAAPRSAGGGVAAGGGGGGAPARTMGELGRRERKGRGRADRVGGQS